MKKASLKPLILAWGLISAHLGWSEHPSEYEDLIARIESRLAAMPGMLGKEYDELHPYYLKYCSTTKYHPHKGFGREGTVAGHAVFYLKGACMDKNRGPSGLRLCPEGANYQSPELGVGLSIDKFLKNVNFYAFPTRTLFLGAELAPGEIFDRSVKQRIIRQILADNILEGVELHEEAYRPQQSPEERAERMVQSGFGTDYALGMARNLYCINVPFPRSVMGEIVDYLNALNDSYAHSIGEDYRGIVSCNIKKDADYHWNLLWDNCTHTPINALAKIGVVGEKPTNLPLLRQVGNIAIPSHAFLDFHKAVNGDVIDVDAYYADPIRREIFLKHQWIPQTEGGLAEFIPIYEKNEVYKQDDHMLVMPRILEDLGKKIRKTTRKAKYSYHGSGMLGFAPNLLHYFIKYQKALAKIEEKEQSLYFKALRARGDLDVIAALDRRIQRIAKKLNSKLAWREVERKPLEKQLGILRKEFEKRQKAANYIAFVEKFKEFIRFKKFFVQNQIVKVTSEAHE